jgi:serine palmitoyltransferase
VDELIDEWNPEPLVPKASEFDKFKLEKTVTVVG